MPVMPEHGLDDYFHTLPVGDRTVEYALSGDTERGEPVLLFYPMGASCRLAALFDWPARRAGAKLICVNRPGMGRTSPAGTEGHLDSASNDAAACLDHLNAARTSLLFLCAGTPFALAFCARFPARLTGRIVGCSAWVSPAECSDAHFLYKLGSAVPGGVLEAAAGMVAHCFRSIPPMIPVSWVPASSMQDASGRLSEEEAALFCHDPGSAHCAARVVHLLATMHLENGSEGADAAVLVGDSASWGVEYDAIRHPVLLIHGEEDATVPIRCADWLLQRLPAASVLYRVPGLSHCDVMLFSIRFALNVILSAEGVHKVARSLRRSQRENAKTKTQPLAPAPSLSTP